MSVVVKGMKMPENCGECPICRHDSMDGVQMEQCNLTLDTFDANDSMRWVRRADNCPLIELPEKHGDLIDRQKLLEDNKHLEYPTNEKYRRDRAWAVGFNAGARHCNEHAVYAKTVIEAEGEG